MTTYETVMVRLTCVTLLITIIGMIVKLLLIIIDKDFKAKK